MKKIILSCIVIIHAITIWAQKQTYDIVTHTPPKGWKKETTASACRYSIIKANNWCTITIYKNTATLGSVEKDFETEWNDLAAKPLNITAAPQTQDVMEANGWKIKSGGAAFTFNNAAAASMLTTFSGHGARLSILVNTNTQDFNKQVEDFIASIDLYTGNANKGKEQPMPGNAPPAPAQLSGKGYAFTTTNFDDGWTSTMQEDWVEVKKGNIKALIHYPKEGTIFPADPEPLTIAAWNILTAPRYSSLANFKTAYINTYDRPCLGMGTATENATGKQVFIVLYRQGQTGWIEFVSPDKNTFIQHFKFDPEAIRWDSESDLMKPLAQMTAYNKFAVAPADFTGVWTSDFTGMQQLYHVYSGNYAGMNINQSKETFQFGAGGTYKWELLVVNGMVGNMKYANVKSSGKFSVPNNWQVHATDIEGKPKKYHAHFSCIKGARLLHLLDADYPGSGIYTVFGKK